MRVCWWPFNISTQHILVEWILCNIPFRYLMSWSTVRLLGLKKLPKQNRIHFACKALNCFVPLRFLSCFLPMLEMALMLRPMIVLERGGNSMKKLKWKYEMFFKVFYFFFNYATLQLYKNCTVSVQTHTHSHMLLHTHTHSHTLHHTHIHTRALESSTDYHRQRSLSDEIRLEEMQLNLIPTTLARDDVSKHNGVNSKPIRIIMRIMQSKPDETSSSANGFSLNSIITIIREVESTWFVFLSSSLPSFSPPSPPPSLCCDAIWRKCIGHVLYRI